jgi:prevent-host-death family protein
MTMKSTAREVPAGVFKARCLALLDEVAQTGQPVVVTKRGKPVARLVPVEEPKRIEGSVLQCDDILSPVLSDWEMNESR